MIRMITPVMKTRRRPYRSPARPATGSNVAWVTKNPVTIHAMAVKSTPKSRAIDGIAMLTMLMFMTESHMPLATTTSANQR